MHDAAYNSDDDRDTHDARHALFTLHDGHDVDDGHSRFHAYLADHRAMFRPFPRHGLTSDPCAFAAAAFRIGSPPIMSPPYIGTHPRVQRAYPRSDDHDRHILVIELAIPTPPDVVDRLPRPHRSWDHDDRAGLYHPPSEYDQTCAHVLLTLGLPIPVDLLPDPAYDINGVPRLDSVKRALRAVTTHASAVSHHLLGGLERPPSLQV